MGQTAIVAAKLGFSYERPVLDDVSIAVAHGEVVALLGTNGAGKTTLVRLVCGDLRPRAGGVTVLGGDPRRPAVRRSMPTQPPSVHPPSGSGRSERRARLPPTVVALIRTIWATPSGNALTSCGGEPTSRPGLKVREIVFSCSATGPTGGA